MTSAVSVEPRTPVDECVHCGFCLPVCPTYVLWGRETDSPRGRIHLVRLEQQARASSSAALVRHFDTCLGCLACVTACPSGVPYDELLAQVRPDVERRARRPLGDRLFRAAVFALFPHPGRLRRIAPVLRVYQRSGLQQLVRRLGLLRRLPDRLQALERLAPPVSGTGLESCPEPRGPVRRRVGLLLGCVQRVFFARVNDATARVLAAEGCAVIVPDAQGCCGALSMHAGRRAEAAGYARRMIDAFESASVDTIVINAAGCGSAMKEYPALLADDPAYAERARAFAARCRDISELLVELEPRAERHPLPMRVAYHDACHLQHAQGVRQQPRRLLRSIPGVELREIAEAEICCGSAGIYNLLEPEAAAALRDRKTQHVLAADADLVVSANPGCLLQIADGIRQAGREMPVVHLVELLDASISGRPLQL